MDANGSIDSYLQHQLEKYPTAFWGNISEVGVGKTFTMLQTIMLDVIELRRRKAEGLRVDANPSFIVVPAQLVAQTYREASTNFVDLDFRVLYGTRSTIPSSDPRYHATMTPRELDILLCECVGKRTNPETARIVIISSYQTLVTRCVTKFTDSQYDSELYVGAWVNDCMRMPNNPAPALLRDARPGSLDNDNKTKEIQAEKSRLSSLGDDEAADETRDCEGDVVQVSSAPVGKDDTWGSFFERHPE